MIIATRLVTLRRKDQAARACIDECMNFPAAGLLLTVHSEQLSERQGSARKRSDDAAQCQCGDALHFMKSASFSPIAIGPFPRKLLLSADQAGALLGLSAGEPSC